jgi:hypothetical protein
VLARRGGGGGASGIPRLSALDRGRGGRCCALLWLWSSEAIARPVDKNIGSAMRRGEQKDTGCRLPSASASEPIRHIVY